MWLHRYELMYAFLMAQAATMWFSKDTYLAINRDLMCGFYFHRHQRKGAVPSLITDC